MKQLPDYGKISFDDFDGMKFEEIVPEACSDAIDLLKKFLVYPSKLRISAQQVIDRCVLSSFILFRCSMQISGFIALLFLHITIAMSSYGFTHSSPTKKSTCLRIRCETKYYG